MSTTEVPRWRVEERRCCPTHVPTWAVVRDGVEIDRYADRAMARAYVEYKNGRIA